MSQEGERGVDGEEGTERGHKGGGEEGARGLGLLTVTYDGMPGWT